VIVDLEKDTPEVIVRIHQGANLERDLQRDPFSHHAEGLMTKPESLARPCEGITQDGFWET